MSTRRSFGSTGVQVPVACQVTWQIDQGNRKSALDGYRPGGQLLDEVVAAFEQLRTAGKIRGWG